MSGIPANWTESSADFNVSSSPWWKQWNPYIVPLVYSDELSDTVSDTYGTYAPDDTWKTCFLLGTYGAESGYNGSMGGRISAVFVILVTSLTATIFPVLARQYPKLRIPEWVYMVTRHFGSGVIITTAFIHLMDPAYSEIGPQSCVGSTWSSRGVNSDYSWCPAIMLTSAVVTFIIDAYCDFIADVKFNTHGHGDDTSGFVGSRSSGVHDHEHGHENTIPLGLDGNEILEKGEKNSIADTDSFSDEEARQDFWSQIAGFLVLEFGVLFHSVMIGLDLGSSEEYAKLYPVLVFHQAFEGLGIGSRMSSIPFPDSKKILPYLFALAYGLCTPIAIAIGIGVRTSYAGDGYKATLITGVLDSISAGILLYTGMVELIGRDFMFNPRRTRNIWVLTLQLFCFLWGVGLMALLGKWA